MSEQDQAPPNGSKQGTIPEGEGDDSWLDLRLPMGPRVGPERQGEDVDGGDEDEDGPWGAMSKLYEDDGADEGDEDEGDERGEEQAPEGGRGRSGEGRGGGAVGSGDDAGGAGARGVDAGGGKPAAGDVKPVA